MRCEHEVCVGAYVLDALEPDEQLRMQQHVPGCRVCSAAALELERLPRLLAAVPAEVPEAPLPSELAFQRFRRSAAAAVPPARPHRWRVAVAAAVLAVAAVAVGVVVAGRAPAPAVVSATADGVHVSASYLPADEGTDVTLRLDGVPTGERCELVAVARDGHEESAGDWLVSYAGTYSWTGWVAMEPAEVARWEVRTTDGQTLVSVAA